MPRHHTYRSVSCMTSTHCRACVCACADSEESCTRTCHWSVAVVCSIRLRLIAINVEICNWFSPSTSMLLHLLYVAVYSWLTNSCIQCDHNHFVIRYTHSTPTCLPGQADIIHLANRLHSNVSIARNTTSFEERVCTLKYHMPHALCLQKDMLACKTQSLKA